MIKSPRQKARANGFADGLKGLPCNTQQYKISWHLSVEYLAGYMDGMQKKEINGNS